MAPRAASLRAVLILLSLLAPDVCRGHDVLTVVPRYAPYEGVEPTGISVPLDLPAVAAAAAEPSLPPPPAGDALAGGSWGDDGAAAVAAAVDAVEALAAAAAAVDACLQPNCPEPAADAVDANLQPGYPQPAVGPAAAAEARSGGGGDGDEEEAGPAAAHDLLARHAELYQCRQGGVQRVFVDHPVFHSSGARWRAACSGLCSPPGASLPLPAPHGCALAPPAAAR